MCVGGGGGGGVNEIDYFYLAPGQVTVDYNGWVRLQLVITNTVMIKLHFYLSITIMSTITCHQKISITILNTLYFFDYDYDYINHIS